MTDVVLALHIFACSALALYGVHRVWMLITYFRVRKQPAPRVEVARWPKVTVQLPLYNERAVAERLIRATCGLDYPRELLTVQVLDDSTDETAQVVAAEVARQQAKGVQVEHVRRAGRAGFKAGALAYGTARAAGELIAIFDADFVPPRGFLRDVVPAFSDPAVGMVQTRWDHLNRGDNWLTEAQAVFLDAHFTIDHCVRDRTHRFFNFNGTAGVWRKSAIARGGGWDAATLTEDLDLSIRAQLAGVRFRYLDEVAVPAELPDDATAFKGQQHRWAKGSIQTARRLLPTLLRSDLPWTTKLDGALKLTQNCAFLFLALVVFTMPVVSLERSLSAPLWLWVFDLVVLALATLPVAVHFFVAGRSRQRSLAQVLLSLPLALGLGAALSINNSWAVLEGLFGPGHDEFVRTPKRGEKGTRRRYRTPIHPAVLLELGLGAWHLFAAVTLTASGAAWCTPFLWTFGLSLVGLAAQSVWAGRPVLVAPAR